MFNQKSRFLFIFIAAVILGVSAGAWFFYSLQQPEYERIRFSYDRYPDYQKQIFKLLIQEFDLAQTSLLPSDIGVSLLDLNDDGIKEIIVYIQQAGGFGGSRGGHTGFYSQKEGNIRLLSDRCLTQGTLAKATHKTNGYHDIVSFVFILPDEKYYKHTLAWVQPFGYEYVRTESVSEHEKKEFTHEDL
jgi:hypothetical protein